MIERAGGFEPPADLEMETSLLQRVSLDDVWMFLLVLKEGFD